tara:strand:- start:644 stop:1210 length:567 start_codon:yes stop_codon:yes gene_type:complete
MFERRIKNELKKNKKSEKRCRPRSRGCLTWQQIRSKLPEVLPKVKPPIHQHAAVIAVNGKVIAKGINHNRSTSCGKLFSSFHAERQAVENWKKRNKGKNQRKLKKLARQSDIYIIRKSRKTGGFCYSSPCKNCTKMLKSFGFRNAIYSVNGGGYKKVNLRKTEINDIAGHRSHAQMQIEKHIPYWKRS